jgi:RNA polymerase sigma factor (sigma-70 family)
MEQEHTLWALFLEGDTTAFAAIMKQHFKHLFNYGMKFCDDTELVKDTIQELFIKLWNKKANLSKSVNTKAYLTASVRRILYRKLQSQNKFENFSNYGDYNNYFDFEVSVEEKLIKKEFNADLAYKITQNLDGLPGRQKEVIYLKFFDELSRDEISEIMGISRQTVSNLLQMALKKLRLQLTMKLLVG